MRKNTPVAKLPRNFIAYVLFSFILIVLVKIMSGNLRSPVTENSSEKKLRIIARAIAKYAIENDNRIPKKISALYPVYCDDLTVFSPDGKTAINAAEEIESKCSYKLNSNLPENFSDIHQGCSLIFIEDISHSPNASTRLLMNANLEVMTVAAGSMKILGLTREQKELQSEKVDENGDGKIDEERYFSEGRLVYSVKKTYSKEGRIFRETWYDDKGEITTDCGPAFRMYNYDAKGRLSMVTNHYTKGEPAASFGVGKIIYKYETDAVTEYYFSRDNSPITAMTRAK